MSGADQPETAESSRQPRPPLPVYLDARATFAAAFLSGSGIEIGALHQPLAVPPHARVRYVDRMTREQLRDEYPELAEWDLTEVDVIDDGEKLTTVADESQDFIVANHFLEHTEDPIGTIETHLRRLKPGGALFYAVPDKRFTFDFRRTPTPIEHMVADNERGPEHSRREHFDEWITLVANELRPDEAERQARELEAAAYSIHMHVWTQAEFLDLILECRRRFDSCFDIEAAARQGIEFIVVLRKDGPLPPPIASTEPEPSLARRLRARLGRLARRTLEKLPGREQ